MPSLGFDTSSYPSAQVAPQDPLAMIGKVLQIQGAQQGLLQQQQEFKFRQAIGPILQQAVDPKTGEIDTGKATVLGLGHPDTAWGMPAFVTQMITNGHMKADTALKEMQVAKDQWGLTTGVAQGLVTKAIENAAGKGHIDPTSGKWIAATPTLSHKEIANGLGDLIAAGGMDGKDAAAFLQRNATSSPEQNFQMVDRIMKSGQNIDQGLARITGTIKANQIGGQTRFTQEIPATGEVKDVGGLVHTPTAEAVNAGVAGIDGKGAPIIRQRIQAYPMTDAAGRPLPGSPQGQSATTITGLSPQETKIQEGRAKNVTDYEEELNHLNSAAQGTLRSLDEMGELLKRVKVGGGAEIRAQLASAAAGFGAPKSVVNAIGNGDLGASQALQKFFVINATDNMKQQFGNAQRYTNLDFNTFLKNSGTLVTQPYGLQKIMQFMRHGAELIDNNAKHYQDIKQNGFSPSVFGGKYKDSDLSSYPTYWNEMLGTARTNANKGGNR
jgi:hypothetical protein